MLLFELSQELIRKFLKFGIVGFSGLFIDFGFTFLSKEKLRVQKYFSNAIGFMMAASSNYILNRIWTFHSEDPKVLVEYSQFMFISLLGLAINTLVLWLIVSKLKWNFYIAKLVAIAVVTVWNFGANILVTFA
ncbi:MULTISPECIES: GtrA family protein [unclassified Lentimicrobium]|uniref:GtrA family protein n=1 Tax=unclassified Lentimicrobium TaxID=2677434 RepID=UPI0020A66A7C|nr:MULTISPECIES: GtrA family protein [unclassified Lentimicrobium]